MINKINNITLESLILFPLFSWISAALFLAGAYFMARKIEARLFFPHSNNLTVSSVYLLVLSVLGLLGFMLSAAGLSTVNNLGAIGIPFIIMGFFQIYNTLKGSLKMMEFLTLENLLLLAYFILACSAVSDADSVSYHLAAPLQVLRNHTNQHLGEYWLQARLIGTGEYINLLGLSFGSDCLGALTQWSVLLLFCKNIKFICSGIKRELIVISVLSMPLILFLVNTQKHQLSGDLAFCLSIGLFIWLKKENKPWTNVELALVLIPSIYALGLRLNNMLTFGLLYSLFFTYLILKQRRLILRFIGITILAYLVFIIPLYYFNFINYNDPTGLFLSTNSKPMADFSRMIKNHQDMGWGFPIGFWLPDGISTYSTTLGLSGILFIFGDFVKKERIFWMGVGIGLFIVQMFFTVLSSRFFLVSFLICIISLSFSDSIYYLSWIKAGLFAQCILSLVFMAITFYTTVPGMFTKEGRRKSQEKMSFSFNMAQWLDTLNLPKDAVLIPHTRGHLFLNRDYLPNEIKYFNSGIIPAGNNYYFTKDHFPRDKDVELIDSTRIWEANRNPFNNKIKTYYLYR